MKLTGNYLAFIIRLCSCLPIQNSEEPYIISQDELKSKIEISKTLDDFFVVVFCRLGRLNK